MMAKEVDFPPVWLAGFAALAGLVGHFLPVVTPVNDGLGAALVTLGLGLVAIAVIQMMIARTSVIPRRNPDALVRGGLFRFSRNPIYLGDALVLAGLCFSWDALLALPLVPVFMHIIKIRFILGEEGKLLQYFGEAYQDYMHSTRRWI